jgi:hypothetical protein
MRVVFDVDTEEIYISAHYRYPGRLIAEAGSAQEDWLLTTKRRLLNECGIMADHSSGATRKQREEIDRLRALAVRGKEAGLYVGPRETTARADVLDRSLKLRATSNKAFAAWLRDPKAYMSKEAVHELYGV